jgi:DNA invertase Pin-like site-specific DNA recombinase
MSNDSLVVYARKSSESEDKQMLSIPAQLAELRAYAERTNLRISAELVESCSAREPGRPVFSKLLADVAAGLVPGILCWRLDRLAQNPKTPKPQNPKTPKPRIEY